MPPTPPAVTGVVPRDGARAVARSAALAVTFDEPIDVATVTPATVTFREVGGASVAHRATFSGATTGWTRRRDGVTVTVAQETFLLAAGPDLGLLYGITTSGADGFPVLVLGR